MKTKLIFSGIILLALVLTTGTFAFTYPGSATTTLEATAIAEPWVTYEPSADQPDWQDILPGGEYDSEILLPNDAGDETENRQRPWTGENWDKVTTDDGWSTYVYNDSKWYHTDLYNLTDFPEEGPISDITVYFRFAGDDGTTAYARAAIKTNGVIFEGDDEIADGIFVTRSYQWTNNPVTHQPWTVDEINALQAGVSLKKEKHDTYTACTQVYVAVNYECIITQGEVPSGNLYDITPHSGYTGDMLVKIYLTNTANLLRAYQYINMKLFVEHSLETPEPTDYQILSLETGVVLFNIEGGSSDNYTVEVTGGSYRLISDEPDEEDITPEFYCEVTQR